MTRSSISVFYLEDSAPSQAEFVEITATEMPADMIVQNDDGAWRWTRRFTTDVAADHVCDIQRGSRMWVLTSLTAGHRQSPA